MNNNNQRPQSREELLERFEGMGDVFEDGSEEFQMYEDDGHFHLNHFGVRLVPDLPVGQGSSRREFNREVNGFLRDMGYSERYEVQGMV